MLFSKQLKDEQLNSPLLGKKSRVPSDDQNEADEMKGNTKNLICSPIQELDSRSPAEATPVRRSQTAKRRRPREQDSNDDEDGGDEASSSSNIQSNSVLIDANIESNKSDFKFDNDDQQQQANQNSLLRITQEDQDIVSAKLSMPTLQGESEGDYEKLQKLRQRIELMEQLIDANKYSETKDAVPQLKLEGIDEVSSTGNEKKEDVQSRLKKVATEHAQRDAGTMLWQSQMRMLADYVPDSKLADDMIFHAGDILICEQHQEPEPHLIGYKAKGTNKKNGSASSSFFDENGYFIEHLNLIRIELASVLDLQFDSLSTISAPRTLFASLETIKVEYEDEKDYARFYGRYKYIMQQECCSMYGGRFFEIITDGGMLYYWKFERFLEPGAPRHDSKGKSVFKLYRLNMDALLANKSGENTEPEFIEHIEIQDDSEKIALSCGFLRNQTKIDYIEKHDVPYSEEREAEFLADQIIVIKYACLPQQSEKVKNLATAEADDYCRNVLVSIRCFEDFNRELNYYYYMVGEKFNLLRAFLSDFKEGPSTNHDEFTDLKELIAAKKKIQKQSTTVSEKEFANIERMKQFKKSIKNQIIAGKEQSKIVVVSFRNNRLYDQFYVSYVDPEGKILKRGLFKQQHEFKITAAFKAKFIRLVYNNCFMTLYDKVMHKFYFRRCDPVVGSKRKGLMILDAIFGKIITVSQYNAKSSSFTVQSRKLDNYGQVFDSLQPFVLAQEFSRFLHCQKKSPLTTHLATEVSRMKFESDLQNQQIVINKKFNNIARRDDIILIWSDSANYNASRNSDSSMQGKKVKPMKPMEVQDQDDSVDQLSLSNVSFIGDEKLLTTVRNHRDLNKKQSLTFLTIQRDKTKRRNPQKRRQQSIKSGPSRTATFFEQYTSEHTSVTFESGNDMLIIFNSVDGELQLEDTGGIEKFTPQNTSTTFNSIQTSNGATIVQPQLNRYSTMRIYEFQNTPMQKTIERQKSAGQTQLKKIGQYSPFKNNSDSFIRQGSSDSYKKNNSLRRRSSLRPGSLRQLLNEPKIKESWQFFYEKVRFVDDERNLRPIIVQKTVHNERSKLLQIQFWICLFDFQFNIIVDQKPIWFPELELLYQPQSISISASTELTQLKEDVSINRQNFQVAISLAHQRRVKIIEFMISWNDFFNDNVIYDENQYAEIFHIGSKELILRKDKPGKIDDIFAPILIPLLNTKNQIEGTQLVFPNGDTNPLMYYFPNTIENNIKQGAKLNPLLSKQGYQLFRNKEHFYLDAVLAYTEIKLEVLQNTKIQMTYEDASIIVESTIRVVLNSVIFDPMAPVYQTLAIKFLLQNSIGRSFESLDWFSPLSVKGYKGELECLMISDKLQQYSVFERMQAQPFSSLIERVMETDYSHLTSETLVVDDESEMNFNRIETFVKDRLLYKPQEIIQRDWNDNSPMHYLFHMDHEMDLMLSRIFKEYEDGVVLPEAEAILKAMTIRFIKREYPLALFHKYFLAQRHSQHSHKIENDCLGETMNFAQQIRGKLMPKKQNEKLQVFTTQFDEHESNLWKDQLVSQFIKGQELVHGLDYKVSTWIIDFRDAFLEDKIEWIKLQATDKLHHDFDPYFYFTKYHLAVLVNEIQQSSACDLDDEVLLRNLIDFQWRDTQKWQYRFFVFYIVGYLCPFFYQVFHENQKIVIICNCSCFLTMLFLFIYEYMQYYKTSFSEYTEDIWNKADVAHISMYICIYFWLRLARSDGSITDFFDFEKKTPTYDPNYYKEFNIKIILVWTNVILMFLAVIKLLNFLRIFENFGLFILLIGRCIYDIKLFFIFMLQWIAVFTVIFYVLKCDIPNYKDYPHLLWWLQLLIQVWRNALGDLQPADYTYFWMPDQKRLDELREVHSFHAAKTNNINVIQASLWIIWFIMSWFNQVIMLNFMIALITNSYERVMRRRNKLMYDYKCDLNREVAIFISYFECIFTVDKTRFNSIILITDLDAEIEDDWTGMGSKARAMVGRLLSNLRFYQDQTDTKINKLAAEQNNLKERVEAFYDENKSQMKSQVQEFNLEIAHLADSLVQLQRQFTKAKTQLIKNNISQRIEKESHKDSNSSMDKKEIKTPKGWETGKTQKASGKVVGPKAYPNLHSGKISSVFKRIKSRNQKLEKIEEEVDLGSQVHIDSQLDQSQIREKKDESAHNDTHNELMGFYDGNKDNIYSPPIIKEALSDKSDTTPQRQIENRDLFLKSKFYKEKFNLDFDVRSNDLPDRIQGIKTPTNQSLKGVTVKDNVAQDNLAAAKGQFFQMKKRVSSDFEYGSIEDKFEMKSKMSRMSKISKISAEKSVESKKSRGLFQIMEEQKLINKDNLQDTQTNFIKLIQSPLLQRNFSLPIATPSSAGHLTGGPIDYQPPLQGNPMMTLMFKKLNQDVSEQLEKQYAKTPLTSRKNSQDGKSPLSSRRTSPKRKKKKQGMRD